MCSKILLNGITIKGLLLQEKLQSIVRSLATEEDILLKDHDTQKMMPQTVHSLCFSPSPFKTKQTNKLNFSFGNRNEDLLKFSCDMKLSFYLPHLSGETNPKKASPLRAV